MSVPSMRVCSFPGIVVVSRVCRWRPHSQGGAHSD
ncbi:hypothetical protein [Cutibacterium phage PAVL45]|nr:hypothetical protein [Cutibacterium phage PAVL45]